MNWDGLIVICAVNSYAKIPMSDQYIARELHKHAPVLYVDPPLSHVSRFRGGDRAEAIGRPGLRIVEPGFARLTPVVQPFPSRSATVGMATTLVRRQLRTAIGKLDGRVRAVLTSWPQYPVAGACGERVSAYWAKDDFAGGAALLGMSAGMLRRRERRVATAADLILVANPEVAQMWHRRGLRTTLLPFGNDSLMFRGADAAPIPPGVSLAGPAAGFVGTLNDRTDLALLEAVSDQAPLLVVGPVDPAFQPARVARLLRRPAVHWAGLQSRAALPGYMRLMGVGLVPYRDIPFNRGSFPLKTLEYLAAGRPVVSTGLPAVRWLGTGLITVADDARGFAAAVAKILAAEPDPDQAAERQAFADLHSWQRRAADMLVALDMAEKHGKISGWR